MVLSSDLIPSSVKSSNGASDEADFQRPPYVEYFFRVGCGESVFREVYEASTGVSIVLFTLNVYRRREYCDQLFVLLPRRPVAAVSVPSSIRDSSISLQRALRKLVILSCALQVNHHNHRRVSPNNNEK